MKGQILTQVAAAHPALAWAVCLTLLMFFGIFVGSVVWVMRRGSGKQYELASLLPFEANHARTGGQS
jgi:hypothetical protein